MIIVDSREQKPLWDVKTQTVLRRKLDEGDYTLEELLGVAHAERKSAIDLYGSLVQGHERFKKEILRAKDKKIKLVIFVECPSEMFFRKRFLGAHRLEAPGSTLRKIVKTMSERYDLRFVWCTSRENMKVQMLVWFSQELKTLQQLKGLSLAEGFQVHDVVKRDLEVEDVGARESEGLILETKAKWG